MKFKILHENRGRIRIQKMPKKMTLEEADALENWLMEHPGVKKAVVHERTGCAVVYYDCSRSELISHISAFGFDPRMEKEHTPTYRSRILNRIYEDKLVGLVAFKAFRSLFFPAPLKIAYTVFKSIPYMFRALKCIVHCKLRVDLLDGLSIGISMLQMDFDTAGSVMFLLRLGELLEEWTRKKSVDDLARCMSLNIDKVWLKTPEGEVLVPLSQAKPGSQVAVRMGSVVPLDGVIEEGEVMVNQASLTGESIPVRKYPGTMIYAGTVIEEGECTLSVQQQVGHSRYDKIVTMIEQSEKLKSAAESRAFSLADKLVPYTLLGSVITYILTRNAVRASSVLMVDFSCAIKLSMPLAVLSAMRESSGYHVTVKGGKFLELVSKADTIVFDKTGTLTHACPVVKEVIPFGGHDEQDMLKLAACLEEHFPHSMANAVVEAADKKNLLHEEMHSHVEYVVAHGIASEVGNEKVVIGSAHFVFEDEGCTIPEGEQEKFDSLPRQYSHLYLAIKGQLAAVILISDPLREEAGAVIKALHGLGVKKIVMLTGDSERTAAAIAEEAGVDDYRSEVLPEDKARFVEEAREQGHTVIMLGDGINDSPALSAADVGIAISDGAAIVREIADITIAADDLFELVYLRQIADCLMRRIGANYRFVLGFNGTLIVLGAMGILAPSTSALLHNLSTLGISMRSMTNLLK